jgi:hypothetical protein
MKTRAGGARLFPSVNIYATEKRPTPNQCDLIEDYQRRYLDTFGFAAWGVHYIPGLPNHGPVWLPCPPECAIDDDDPTEALLPVVDFGQAVARLSAEQRELLREQLGIYGGRP